MPSGRGTTLPGDADDRLGLQVRGARAELGVALGVELDLGDPLAVAQVDEDDAAVVADGVDPAGERDGRAEVGLGQLGTVVGAFHGRVCGVETREKAARGAIRGNPILGRRLPALRLERSALWPGHLRAACGSPMSWRTVGAMSARRPPSRIRVLPGA